MSTRAYVDHSLFYIYSNQRDQSQQDSQISPSFVSFKELEESAELKTKGSQESEIEYITAKSWPPETVQFLKHCPDLCKENPTKEKTDVLGE